MGNFATTARVLYEFFMNFRDVLRASRSASHIQIMTPPKVTLEISNVAPHKVACGACIATAFNVACAAAARITICVLENPADCIRREK